MAREALSFRIVRRSAIGVGTFLFGWGWVGVVPLSVPFTLPAITLPALPALEWPSSPPLLTGIGPMSGIPEPTSWGLMIGGMLLLGFALRSAPRRRLQRV